MTLITRRRLAAALAGALTTGASLLVPSSSHAAAPPTPVASAFDAPPCPGTTDFSPTSGDGGVSNLLSVFGERLTSYNAGHIVPLYDSQGGNVGAYPPLCGVRYVEAAGGPVSEWMFCTDLASKVCGETATDGQLQEGATPVDPLEALDVNPRLNADQEKIIAYLIQHGYAYSGTGSQSWGGVTTATSSGTSNQRMALQTLVWCVSDPTPNPPNADYEQTCADSMDAAEQERVLALIPADPEVTLDLVGSQTQLNVGQTARFTLRTNLFDQPITLASSGSASTVLTVCEGEATLSDDQLVVPADGTTAMRQITLCAAASQAGTFDLTATAEPASTTHIGWNQSPTQLNGDACQVFAAFYSDQLDPLTASASLRFVEVTEPTPTPTTPEPTDPAPTDPEPTDRDPSSSDPGTPTDSDGDDRALPNVGTSVGLPLIAAALVAALFGATIAIPRRRQQN